MRQRTSCIRLTFLGSLVFALFIFPAYSVSTVLESPADGFIDDDGFLDLRASCEPASEKNYDGTTSWNVTKAALYSNISGIWREEGISQAIKPIANSTYFFNSTNLLIGIIEGEFKWNVQCHEVNSTNNGAPINKNFAVNRTLKVKYAKPTVTITSPADGDSDTDGYEIDVVCKAVPSSEWNITRLSILTDLSGRWKINQTHVPSKPTQDAEVTSSFTINKLGNNSLADGTRIVFGCSAVQAKNLLEGILVTEEYSLNRTIIIAYPPQQCIAGACDSANQKWCEDNAWKSGEFSEYCAHCSYSDKRCPVCTNNACDADNKKWCNEGVWSAIGYCSNCASVDASCAGTCTNNICDTKNKKWCNNNVWEGANYCMQCNNADSSCFFKCSEGICDIKNKKWCNQGVWKQTDYQSRCSNKDFYYAASCQTSICDAVYNRWCDSSSWTSLNYCDNCEDSDCLGTCLNNACDINAKKWCDSGEWSNLDYCLTCGNKDSSCSVTCQEGICDTTSNKRCLNGVWNSTNYCDYCSSADRDCTIVCAEGECDTINRKVCINSEWNSTTESIYCSFCSPKDTTCRVECLAIADGCCLNASDTICDADCASGVDLDCLDCTFASGDCCFPKNDTICDLDCAGSLDYDCTDAGCKGSGTCRIGLDCTTNSQCASGFCFDDKCAEQCGDNVQDGDETDADCGGSCAKCDNYKKCELDSDCSSGFCPSGICLEEDTCADAILGGDETGIDCGGSCPNKCQEGYGCITDTDCEPDFECVFDLCSEKIIETAPHVIDEEKDSDKDGILDKWELKYGMDILDQSDAEMDLDEDGLTNLQEYTLGTNPSKADTDGDKVSDKKEIEVGTDPLDPISKPGGIGGLLFIVTILIILFGAGGYGVFYYIHYIKMESAGSEQSLTNIYNSQTQYVPPRQAPRKEPIKIKVDEVIQKRREEKKKLRDHLFMVFDNRVEQQPTKPDEKIAEYPKKTSQILSKKEKAPIKPIQKSDVFSKLERLYKKEEENREK